MSEFERQCRRRSYGTYWDWELAELANCMSKEVNAKIWTRQKEGKLDGKEKARRIGTFKSEIFTKKELKIVETGKSAGTYHYRESSQILGPIGNAFADAMAKLRGKQLFSARKLG